MRRLQVLCQGARPTTFFVGACCSVMASPVKEREGEVAARRILASWKGEFIGDACFAANQIGLLHSGGKLALGRAKEIIRQAFDARQIDDVNWSSFNEAFENGRAAV